MLAANVMWSGNDDYLGWVASAAVDLVFRKCPRFNPKEGFDITVARNRRDLFMIVEERWCPDRLFRVGYSNG